MMMIVMMMMMFMVMIMMIMIMIMIMMTTTTTTMRKYIQRPTNAFVGLRIYFMHCLTFVYMDECNI